MEYSRLVVSGSIRVKERGRSDSSEFSLSMKKPLLEVRTRFYAMRKPVRLTVCYCY